MRQVRTWLKVRLGKITEATHTHQQCVCLDLHMLIWMAAFSPVTSLEIDESSTHLIQTLSTDALTYGLNLLHSHQHVYIITGGGCYLM